MFICSFLEHLVFILHTQCGNKCNPISIVQMGSSRSFLIDIVLAHPTMKKFLEPVAAERVPSEVAKSSRRNLNFIETVLRDSLDDVQEESFVSDRISKFAARIVIEKETQIASIYAGTLDSNLEIFLGVIRIAPN